LTEREKVTVAITICAKHNGIWYYGQIEMLEIMRLIQQKKDKIAYKLPDGTIIAFKIPTDTQKPRGTSKTEIIVNTDGIPVFSATIVEKQKVAEATYKDC